MKSRSFPHQLGWIVGLTFAVLLGSAAAQAPETDVTRVVAQVEAALGLADLSEELWPGWDISRTPFALLTDDTCYLVHHPRPPSSFDRVGRGRRGRKGVHAASLDEVGIDPASGEVGSTPTAFAPLSELSTAPLPITFREAFRLHQVRSCAEVAPRVEARAGFPADARNLALVNIECGLLRRALAAAPDSLERLVLEFSSVRSLRRVGMEAWQIEYEESLELHEGIPAYIAESVRALARSHLDGDEADLLSDALGSAPRIDECRPAITDVSWYRGERFLWTGAAVCMLLDRYHPDWKSTVAEDCVDPFSILYELTRRHTPRASELIARHGFSVLVAEASTFIEERKSEPEKLYERITGSQERLLTLNVGLLQGVSVTYDPNTMEKIDAHREVHPRLLKMECSGGTLIELTGRPVAASMGDGEFDYRQLVVEAPDDIRLTVGGRSQQLQPGVNHLDRPFVLEGSGVRVAASAGVVIVGENGTAVVIHR